MLIPVDTPRKVQSSAHISLKPDSKNVSQKVTERSAAGKMWFRTSLRSPGKRSQNPRQHFIPFLYRMFRVSFARVQDITLCLKFSAKMLYKRISDCQLV